MGKILLLPHILMLDSTLRGDFKSRTQKVKGHQWLAG